MPRLSAGLLLYKKAQAGVEVLLVHPGGPFWANKQSHAWSIPKGEYTTGEDALQAAKREFQEETGLPAPKGSYHPLGEVHYGNKKLSAWALSVADLDVGQIASNTFAMEWPPKSGRMQQFPEVDKVEWVTVAMARQRLVKGQVPLIDQLLSKLGAVETPCNDDAAQLPLF